MSQKWKMCLVSERGQTRAWIFITCTATRWRRPIHQAELSRWSQTFPIKTPPPPPLPSLCCLSLSLCESRRSVRMGGKRDKWVWKRKQTCFAQLWTSSPAQHIPSLTAFPWLHRLHHFYLISAFVLFLWSGPDLFLAITLSILLWPAEWTVRKGRIGRHAARQLREILKE